MSIDSTIKKIKNLEIQGATNISKAALKAFSSHAAKIKVKSKEQFFREMGKAKIKLSHSRPTEPEMRNFLNFVYHKVKSSKEADVKKLQKETKKIVEEALKIREKSLAKIIKYGSNLIKKNAIVYTHCHSSTVTKILIEAHKHKKISVHNTETRPRYQGRITAKELAKNKIKVFHFVDSAIRLALKKSDIVMLGADSITTTKVLNKIGSELVVEMAEKYDIPVYICASSWKFNLDTALGLSEIIERRNPSEVWNNPPKGVEIMNYAFEKIDLDKITAIVSDFGILKPQVFVQEVRKKISPDNKNIMVLSCKG